MDSMNRVSGVLAFGAVLTALSFSAGAAAQSTWKTPCGSDPGNHNIEVGTIVSCKLAAVSKKNGNTVTWKSVDPAHPNVKIVFDDPDAFKNIKDCDGSHVQCNSGVATKPGNDNWVYLYKAYTCNKGGAGCNLVVDPGIIINP